MATKQQTGQSAEQRAADAMTLITSGTPHHFRAGAALSIGNARIPRGAILPPELVQAFDTERLHIMLRNNLIVVVLGPEPKAADEKVAATFVEPPPADQAQREREALVAALKRDGYQPWEYDAKVPVPPGAYAPTPPPAPERSWHDQSLASNRTVGITGT
jgi:hypothetical protein